MVCIDKKYKSVQICWDLKVLIRAVKCEHQRIPTLEDIASQFNEIQHYTIMDMKLGYWDVTLAGFMRTPFSAKVFEKMFEQISGVLLSVSAYFDDFIVAGKTQQ
ncbi:uncharacterized protein [Watersipora subatra]|uniref:uncharacterized protein n=1 Tax=Watersipora subatra TaxID=2589382 RepID=UPI00355B6073